MSGARYAETELSRLSVPAMNRQQLADTFATVPAVLAPSVMTSVCELVVHATVDLFVPDPANVAVTLT